VNTAFVRLNEVTKRFGQHVAVDRASFEIGDGEIVALLGPSGCGKTTVLRLIAGLETPDAGELWIAGERVAAEGRNYVSPRARMIGFVFQDLALWPHMTVKGNLDFVLGSRDFSKADRKQRVYETLQLLHADAFVNRYPNELSGGEQQRVAFARALVSQPRLLLLDEPMSSLDADLKTQLLEEFTELQHKLGVTTVYVTHDRQEASSVAHRTVSLHNGQPVQ
jgi:iron(III) transport system ATP-binding protein